MRNRLNEGNKRRRRRVLLLSLIAVLALGSFASWISYKHADNKMRNNLLKQALLISRSIDFSHIQTLTGTQKDKNTQNYQNLREQLIRVKDANINCTYVYIMDRNKDGQVYFMIDAQTDEDEDTPPAEPGEIYDDASEELVEIFDKAEPFTEGPLPDKWGVWVSAIVPVTNPNTGELIAVLGIDVDAKHWKLDAATDAAPVAGLIMTLMILLSSRIIAKRSRSAASLKPVQRRLLIPLATIMVLLVGGFLAAMLITEKENLSEDSLNRLVTLSGQLENEIIKEAHALIGFEDIILRNPNVIEALKAEDRDRLFKACNLLFIELKEKYGITHFYFHKPDRTNLLRVYNPEKRGGLIDRFTLKEAERTGHPMYGIELGSLCSFTLRAVYPVYQDESLLGYIELGKEIDEILESLSLYHNMELSIAVHKTAATRKIWEAGLDLHFREFEWERFENSFITFSTLPTLPSQIEYILSDPDKYHWKTSEEVSFRDRRWRVMMMPFQDASGAEIADLVAMMDISDERDAFNRILIMSTAAAVVLFASLFAFLYVLLKRIDEGINKQHEKIVKSEEVFDLALSAANDGIWDWRLDVDTVHFDARFYTMAGYEPGDFPSTLEAWREKIHPDDITHTRLAIYEYLSGARENYDIECRFCRKDGSYMWIRSRGLIVERSEIGKPTRFIGTNTDITAQHELLLETTQIKQAVDASSDAIGIFTGEGNSFYHNKTFTEMFGYSDEEDYEMQELYAEHSVAEEVCSTVKQGGSSDREAEMRAKNNRRFPVHLRVDSVKDENGQIVAIILALTDITDRKANEAKITKTFEEMERINQVMNGRELRVIEMKKEVNELRKKYGLKPKYGSVIDEQQ